MRPDLGYSPENGYFTVSEMDPAYRENRETLRTRSGKVLPPFGEEMFRGGEFVPGMGAVARRKILNIIRQGPSAASEARSLFVEALRSPEVLRNPVVQELTRGTPGSPGAPAELLSIYIDRGLPEDLMALVLSQHIGFFEESERRLIAELPKMRERFEKGVQKLMGDRSHPLSSDMLPLDLIERRLSEVGVHAVDPLAMLDRHVAIGEYDAEDNFAGLFYDRTSVAPKSISYHNHIYGHEMWHVLSGRTITERGGHFAHPRIGLRTEGEKFTWINEAITETLSQDISPNSRNWVYGHYVPQRFVYKQLLKRIPEELFLYAYFENSDPQNQGRTRWKTLVGEVDRAYQPGFLSTLDFMMQENPEEAGRMFNALGQWEEH